MDVQLQELIDKIKKDGVATAEKESEKIISDSEVQAEKIIKEAKLKAEEIIKEAKSETQRMQKASEEAIIQAGRNMLLLFKESLIKELNNVIQVETSKVLSKDLLSTLIPQTIKEWAKNCDVGELSILLSEKDLSDLEKTFTSELKTLISDGLEIKVDKTLSSGFRIGVKNGEAFYDYSAESLATMFSAYLNPKVSALIEISAKEVN